MSDESSNNDAGESPPLHGGQRIRLVVFLLLVAAVGVTWWLYRDEFSACGVLGYKDKLDEQAARRPAVVYGAAFLIYVGVTGMSLPVAAPLSLLYGALFGFWPSLVLISIGSTAGATIAFLVSRYLLRDSVQARFGRSLTRINAELESNGAFYLFTLRLTPVFPFWMVNLAMGVTPIPLWTYCWVSQLGMLPGSCLYVYAGATIDIERLAAEGAGALITWQMVLALVLLGLMPLVFKKLVDWWRAAPNET